MTSPDAAGGTPATSAINASPSHTPVIAAAPSPIVMMTAADLSDAIGTKQVSSREVMTAYLDHIDRVNPQFNAIVSLVDRATLLTQADAADAALAKGERRGWMHGLPHAVKDLAPTKGIRTTLGSPLFADDVPTVDAIFVERLKAAGAIIMGKTNTPEFGLGSHTYNKVFGVTRNAYNPTKSAGGSSGGAAVGVALRLLPVADGSDFGGSLRNPAGWNGIYGMRPSMGRVPLGPTNEIFMQSIGYEGPMARTPRDLAMLLSVMAGRDDRAPLSLTDPADAFAAPLDRDMTGTRIGLLGDLGGLPMEAGMLDLCLAAMRRMEDVGCTIESASLGMSAEAIWAPFVTLRHGLMAGRMAAFYHDPVKRASLKPEAIWEIENGLRLSAVDLYAASVGRSAVYQAFRALFERFDVLALPSAQMFPFDADIAWPTHVGGVAMDSYHRWMEIVGAASLAGLPTVAVPAGFGAAGLPSGVQIIGPPRSDFAVLQFAQAYAHASASVLDRLPPALVPSVGS